MERGKNEKQKKKETKQKIISFRRAEEIGLLKKIKWSKKRK